MILVPHYHEGVSPQLLQLDAPTLFIDWMPYLDNILLAVPVYDLNIFSFILYAHNEFIFLIFLETEHILFLQVLFVQVFNELILLVDYSEH
jgi:hypothetical protein